MFNVLFAAVDDDVWLADLDFCPVLLALALFFMWETASARTRRTDRRQAHTPLLVGALLGLSFWS